MIVKIFQKTAIHFLFVYVKKVCLFHFLCTIYLYWSVGLVTCIGYCKNNILDIGHRRSLKSYTFIRQLNYYSIIIT